MSALSSTAQATGNDAAATPRSERARVARAASAFGLVALAVGTAPALATSWSVARELDLARGSGYAACLSLVLTLAVTPLAALARRLGRDAAGPTLSLVRRALGMTSAWLALAHSALAFLGPLDARPAALLETSHLYAGVAALGILLLLLLTSYAAVLRVTRLRAWKELHRLSYLAALLVVQHVLLSPYSDPRVTLGLLIAVAGLLLSRVPAAIAAARR